MPNPPGCAPHAPMTVGLGPASASCARISQLAVVNDCQIPFRLGLPSSARATPADDGVNPGLRAGACPAIGIAANENAPAATTAIVTLFNGICMGYLYPPRDIRED